MSKVEKSLKLKFELTGFSASLDEFLNFSSKMSDKEEAEKMGLKGQNEDS